MGSARYSKPTPVPDALKKNLPAGFSIDGEDFDLWCLSYKDGKKWIFFPNTDSDAIQTILERAKKYLEEIEIQQ